MEDRRKYDKKVGYITGVIGFALLITIIIFAAL